MITKINEFTDALKSGKLKRINERFITEEELANFGADELIEDIPKMDETGDLTDELTEEPVIDETPTITLDSLKDALMNRFNNTEDDLGGDEETIDAPVMLSDEQLQIVFDTLTELGVVQPDVEDTENDDFKDIELGEENDDEGDDEGDDNDDDDDDDDDEIDEAFDFLKNAYNNLKGKLNKFVGEDEESIQKRKEALVNFLSPVEGKGAFLVDNETDAKVEITTAEEALEAIASPNNYNGIILPKPIRKDGEIKFVYKYGDKGIQKIGRAAGSVTRIDR